jgi:hypothetical protein
MCNKNIILAAFLVFISLNIMAQTKHSVGINANLGLMQIDNKSTAIYPVGISYCYKKSLGIKAIFDTRVFSEKTPIIFDGPNRFFILLIEGKRNIIEKGKFQLGIGVGSATRWRRMSGTFSDTGIQGSLSLNYQLFPHFAPTLTVSYYGFHRGGGIFVPISLNANFLF